MDIKRYEGLLNHTKALLLIHFILLLIFGGYFAYYYYNQDNVVVYAECEKVLFTEQIKGYRRNYICYVCELGYDYNGVHYNTTAELQQVKVGDKIKLRIDSQNPSIYTIAQNDWMVWVAMIGIPAVMFIVFFFFWDSDPKTNSEKDEEVIKKI